MRKRSLSISLILSLILIFPACAFKKTLNVGEGSREGFSSPLAILEEIDSTSHSPGGIKAIARIEVNTPEGRFPLKVALALQRPSSLRLESVPLIGPADFFLTVHENVLKVFVPNKGKFYIGEATKRNLAHFLPIAASGPDIEGITSILIGTHPEIRGKSITLEGSPDGILYRLDILSENRKIQSLWVDSEKRLVRVDLFAGDDSRLYSAKFTGCTCIENVILPENVTIVYGDNDKPDIIIRYVYIEPAKGIDAMTFDLEPPPGIIPIPLDQ